MHQRKILLLENVATQAAGLRERLSQAGHQVTVSRYESDGLKRLVEWEPDLVLVSTAHPGGDFVEYCRRVRALAPHVRIVVTATLDRDRLFQEYPGLQEIVDGVLKRPFRPEEVAELLSPAAVATPAAAAGTPAAPVAEPAAPPAAEQGLAEMRAEFQRQLDDRFLEVEELKRHLAVATKRAASAPGLEWLQSENEHLRHGVEEAQKKAALALATEQLKRSEIEVKLDNLLRMKEDFEFRTQNELEERSQELEAAHEQLRELRERSSQAAAEHIALRGELERALVEKEQLEERLHSPEGGGQQGDAPPAPPAAELARIAELEAEVSRQRALAAEEQLALADMVAKAAVLEESLAHEAAAREQREQLLGQVRTLREEAEEAHRRAAVMEKELADLRLARAGETDRLADLQHRLADAESSTASARSALLAAEGRAATLAKEEADLQNRLLAAEAAAVENQAALIAARNRGEELERELGESRQKRAEDARLAEEQRREAALREREVLDRAAEAERRREQLQAACSGLEERLAASEAARVSVAAEAEALVEQVGTRGASLAADLEIERAARAEAERRASDVTVRLAAAQADAPAVERLERELAQAAERARDLERVRSHQELRIGEQAEELRSSAERLEQAARDLEKSEGRVAALDGELAAERKRLTESAAAGEARSRETRELEARLREAEAASREAGGRLAAAEAALRAARDEAAARERELQLQLEAQRAAARDLEERLASRTAPAAEPVPPELHRIQELLEEVISRARTEAVEYARRDAELSVRLQAALDERRLLQERFDRASAEATERERRSSSLLQSAIDHGPFPQMERANLPAVVPLEPEPDHASVSGISRRKALLAGLAAAGLAALLAFFWLRPAAPPAVRERPAGLPRPQAGAATGAAATPREVWERWTRSDGSGGVLVQATLRSEQELRAEVEAERARGMSDAQVQAELERRMRAFRFDTTWYVTVYLKNLSPGYPAYLDDLPGRFRLRDGSGREVPAFLPPGHEKDRRVFSFGAGAPGDLLYEASVSLGFDRAGLSPSAGYLQLVVSDVGASSRRVLTWELE